MNNTTMQSDESILYNYYYSNAIKEHELLTQKLVAKDFQYLREEGKPYVSIKGKETVINSADIDTVINQLQEIKANAEENEGLAWVESSYNEDNESFIVVTSYLFSISNIIMCERMAKQYTKDSLWRLQNQPNSIQAKNLRSRIDKLTATEDQQQGD